MKRLSLILMLVLFSISITLAQRTVSGTITDSSGETLIGANVLAKGTNAGTVTDIDGKYSINVAEGIQSLMISYTGYATQEVELGASNVLDITMQEGVALSEVVITALGIERDEKALGYSVQEVDGEDLSLATETNVVSALGGKVAGVQVVTASGASLGGSANIKIRGANGLDGGSPLFVVDGTPISNRQFDDKVNDDAHRGVDYGNLASDINPDDIASISVLKGPSATALYGQRAANGVVMITTKKGKKGAGIGVSWNSAVTMDNVYVLPTYQNEYAGGYTQDFLKFEYDPTIHGAEYAAFDGQNLLNYAADESWGPRIDGSTLYRPWWSWYPGTPEFGQEVPLTAQPDNIKNFFDTGVNYTNNVALSGGNESTSFRLSYTNVSQTGVIPNSSLSKNNLSLNASTELTDKLTLSTSVNVAVTQGEGRPSYGYTGNNAVLSLNQWFQRQLDIDRLRDYKNADGSFRSWNIRSPTNARPLYWDSPFFSLFENFSSDKRDRYFGNATLSYKITDNLSVQGSARRDSYNQRIERRTATGGLDLDEYAEIYENANEDNLDFLFQYNKSFGDISFDANFGGNQRTNQRRYNYIKTEGGLNAPNLYNVKASTDRPDIDGGLFEKQVRSLYGSANFGYKSFAYIGFTLRNDWSSALPTDNNSYLYPSVSGSFVFSELMDVDFLSYGKLRGSFAQVGSDLDAYQTSRIYENGTPYGSFSSFNVPDKLINQLIEPALTNSYEFGVDLRFLNNRVGLDITYYNQDAKNQILTVDVPGSSGYDEAVINAGHINSKGVELALTATPIQNANFNWDVTFNIAKNSSSVIELADGLDNRRLDGWGWGGFAINAPVGGEWGTMIGTGYKIDEASGLPVINMDGTYVEENNKDLGGILPDFTGGLRNFLTYKGVSLGAFIDFQVGGQFHSITKMFNAYSGLAEETAGLNDKGNPLRDPVDEGGGLLVEGVLEDGTAHSVYTDVQGLYEGNFFAFHERWIYDASYVKLRELSLGYSIPKKMLGKLPVQSLSLSFIGRNVWLIHSNVDGIDPSEITPGTNGFVFQENGILPGVRSFGLKLNVGF